MKYCSLKLYGLIFVLPWMLMTSCFSEEDFPSDFIEEGGKEMQFRAEVSQQYVTRANDNGFADGDKIGVFVVNYKDGEPQNLALTGNHADNVRFVYDDESGDWEGSYQLYWKDSETPVDAYGYYPFDDNLSSITAYPFAVHSRQDEQVAQTDVTGYEASDFLWAKAENLHPSSSIITLDHEHKMAGIQITLIEGIGFNEGEWESLVKQVMVENTRLGATISLQTGVVTVDSGSESAAITPLASGNDFRAIVVPQTVEADKTLISITVGGVSYAFKRPEAMSYLAGKLHKFTLEVGKSLPEGDYKFSLVQEAVVEWQNDPVSHNGTAREYITVHVNEDECIEDVINRMGIDPKRIINLKLTGVFAADEYWYGYEDRNFVYIRNNMPYLEAVNMKELRTLKQRSFYTSGNTTDGYGPYNQPEYADDYIPLDAFKGMKYLSYVVWPDNLAGIGDEAFVGCNLRGSLIFPEGLKHIGTSVFEAWNQQNNALTGELYLPTTLEYVGTGAFNPHDNQKCNLTGDFVLPAGILYIGENAFGPCHLLTGKIHIPEKLDILNKGAFPENLTGDVRVPQGIKVVNGISKKISSVYFPEGVVEIGEEAFKDVATLKGDQAFPSTLRIIARGAFSGTSISHIKFSEGIDIISDNAFSNCKYLQDTLTLPASLLKIEQSAFYDCEKLEAIILPENLQSIGSGAFGNCRSLNYIRCMSVEPPSLDASAFNGVEKNNFTVVVPPEAVDAYKQASGWKEFTMISGYSNFVCRPMKAELLNKGDERTIVLNADGLWTVTAHPEWAVPSVKEGDKKTELKVTISDLPCGNGNRTGSIVFTLTGTGNESPITCTYDITQYDSEYGENTQVCIHEATKGSNEGINVTFVGDGYSAKDIYDGSFIADVEEGMEYFFGIQPFANYKEYFNVNVAFALSPDSGVCSNVNIWRKTKFGTTYGAGAEGRLQSYPDAVMYYILNEVENSSINQDNVDESLVICILNSDVYEGVTNLYETGAAVAFVPHSRHDYPNDFRGLIQHEACGHGFGKLADEYIYHREYIQKCLCTCCEHVEEIHDCKARGWYRNISLSGKYSDIEWRDLIFHENYDDIVDIYEGAFFHARGVYRSEANSCMNNNVPYFSTVSRQAIVERIMDYAGEEFNFDDFVNKDSREYGEAATRALVSEWNTGVVLHNPAPIVLAGSPLDYIKTK